MNNRRMMRTSGCQCAMGGRNEGRSGMTRNENGGGVGGCGCGCNQRPSNSSCKSCDTLMRKIQELDFSIQEVVLYLDAYPDCGEALAYYHRLVEERQEAVAEYEEKCAPINFYGVGECRSWDWVKSPWPWEVDFPGNGEDQSRRGDRRSGCSCRNG